MTPGRAALAAILNDCGVPLDDRPLDQLWTYHRMLREANVDLNLTRIHNFANMVLKHYVDSLLVLRFEDLPGPIIDMGSGPGLPGIPLKIARPEVPMILAEPRGARAEFLEQVVARLGLTGVEVFAGKVNAKFPRPVRGVITRAVAAIPETLTRVARCLEVGGRMLFMKGPDCDAEIAEARRDFGASFRLVADHRYQIPGTPHDRRLVVFERLAGDPPGQDEANGSVSVYGGPVREVASASNPMYKQALDLLTGPGIRKQGRALIAGARIVREVVARHPNQVDAWLTPLDGPKPPPEVEPSPVWLRLAEPLFRTLDVAGTKSPLLMVRLPAMPEWSLGAPWPAGCTLFVPLQDPENVGAVIRSAAAFGVARVVLLREAAHPFHPKAARAAGPALFQIPIEHGPSLADLDPAHFEAAQVPLIALAADGPAIDVEPFPDRFGLVVGLEGPGLSARLRAGATRTIPIEPGVESLNAATAAALALFAWRRSPGRS